MPRVGIEPMIEQAKTVHASDRGAIPLRFQWSPPHPALTPSVYVLPLG
jgi:hypothetical protein